MSRGRPALSACIERFPRVSGDEPDIKSLPQGGA